MEKEPESDTNPLRQAGSIEFVQHIRSQREILTNEIQRRRVVVEDEWQTVEDCLDDGLCSDASFYLSRMISEAKRLLRAVDGIGDNFACPENFDSGMVKALNQFERRQ